MADSRNPMKYLCTEESRVKRLYYGDIYRSTFSVSGYKQAWDILNIRIPFDPDKEAYFMRRFNFSREDEFKAKSSILTFELSTNNWYIITSNK